MRLKTVDGLRPCAKCKRVLPLSAYYPRRGGNHDSHCKECDSTRKRQQYVLHGEHIRAQQRQANRDNRLSVLRHYSGGTPKCACCGETRYEFLAIDHIYGSGLAHRKRVGLRLHLWLKRNGLPLGFQILCHNCNMSKGFYGMCAHSRVLPYELCGAAL